MTAEHIPCESLATWPIKCPEGVGKRAVIFWRMPQVAGRSHQMELQLWCQVVSTSFRHSCNFVLYTFWASSRHTLFILLMVKSDVSCCYLSPESLRKWLKNFHISGSLKYRCSVFCLSGLLSQHFSVSSPDFTVIKQYSPPCILFYHCKTGFSHYWTNTMPTTYGQ